MDIRLSELNNIQHEMFAHFVASGTDPVFAMVGAGYPRNKRAAERLALIPHIKARIDVLRQEIKEEKHG